MVTDVSRRIAAGAGDQSLHLRPRWADRETFVLEQTRAIYTRGDAGHTPAAYCRMSKGKHAELWRWWPPTTRPQPCFPLAARKASTSSRETLSKQRFCSPSQPKNFF